MQCAQAIYAWRYMHMQYMGGVRLVFCSKPGATIAVNMSWGRDWYAYSVIYIFIHLNPDHGLVS